jgi:hypothetical protein
MTYPYNVLIFVCRVTNYALLGAATILATPYVWEKYGL